MNVECFFDTNILVYAVDTSSANEQKRVISKNLIQESYFSTSAQVLQEFFVTVTRKFKQPLTASDALEWIDHLSLFPCAHIDPTLVKVGIELSERFMLSYWDGAILASAHKLGANTVYSEDLNHSQVYGAVTVLNPYL